MKFNVTSLDLMMTGTVRTITSDYLYTFGLCRYLVMAQSELTTTLNDWMRKHNSSVSHTDVTDQLSVIRLLGPRVTKLLDNSVSLSIAN